MDRNRVDDSTPHPVYRYKGSLGVQCYRWRRYASRRARQLDPYFLYRMCALAVILQLTKRLIISSRSRPTLQRVGLFQIHSVEWVGHTGEVHGHDLSAWTAVQLPRRGGEVDSTRHVQGTSSVGVNSLLHGRVHGMGWQRDYRRTIAHRSKYRGISETERRFC
jgi:hypothetical protein